MTRALRMIGLLGTTLVMALVMGGCYKRVIREEGGFGRTRETIHEPNLRNERIPVVDDVEDAVFGKRKPLDK